MSEVDVSKTYSVKQVSELSGITVRALHHYDAIGLLKPASRSEKNYRFYGQTELLRLQQILFYRELDFSLDEIQEILDDPDFDAAEALSSHREKLISKQQQLAGLIETVDKTLAGLKGDLDMPVNDKDLYGGFDQEKIDRWNREVDEKYDPEVVAESRKNISRMSKGQFKDVKEQGEFITQAIAHIMEKGPSAPEVQELIKEHHGWIENFYACPSEMYKGLGQMYGENEEFTAYYEKFKPGLARFMGEAMAHYADNSLS